MNEVIFDFVKWVNENGINIYHYSHSEIRKLIDRFFKEMINHE